MASHIEVERGMHRESTILPNSDRPALRKLSKLLLADRAAAFELPPVTDLTACATSIALGVRRKALLPLASTPVEYALARRGDRVLVSCYATGSAPEVHQWDRPVALRDLLDTCARASLESARLDPDPHRRRLAVRLAERALRVDPIADPGELTAPVHRRGGTTGEPRTRDPLAFGFDVRLFPDGGEAADRSVRADVHALLFDGTLFAHVRGRRIVLARGPIMLAVQRMVDAVRALTDAWQAGRPTNVRLRSGGFRIGVRRDRAGEVTLTLATAEGDEVTATALDVAQASLPILRVASSLLRTVVSVDRSQSRNLRVRSLRQEVRTLRRVIRSREEAVGFVNQDPDRLRTAASAASPADERPRSARARGVPTASLRFTERWRFELEGLDAASVFTCGERIVVSTPRHSLALDRETGEVLWARDGMGAMAWMAGRVLLRVLPDGEVELCDVEDGEPFAHARIAVRNPKALQVTSAGGGTVPPVAIVTEGSRRIVAIDLRTGELRWRFGSRSDGVVRTCRAGRVLLVASGEGTVSAVDVATGEVVWRHGDRWRFSARPAVSGEVAVVAGGGPGDERGSLHGLDLFSGALRWSAPLSRGPAGHPVAARGRVLVPTGDALAAFDAVDGSPLWCAPDPGLGKGAAPLVIDHDLVLNAPGGTVTAIQLGDGAVRWQHALGDAPTDEVPRRLEPVLRGGALFVPASRVHVVRPADGTALGDPLPCDLVPDLLRVDERGWVYVVEESGQLAALAPAPRLRLIRGGA